MTVTRPGNGSNKHAKMRPDSMACCKKLKISCLVVCFRIISKHPSIAILPILCRCPAGAFVFGAGVPPDKPARYRGGVLGT
jgi:hypothetical protein